MGIRIRIGGLKIGSSSLPYWKQQFVKLFTGIPVPYTGNPLNVESCLVRQVLKVNGIYYLYEETGNLEWDINFRTSLDGFNYTYKSAGLFAKGVAGSWNEKGHADPTVIYDGIGDWKLWGDAKKVGTIYTEWSNLFYATSADGKTWANQGSILTLGSAGQWDDGFVHQPCVVKWNGVYYMIYVGARSSSGNYKLGLATSIDGINWNKSASNPIMDLETENNTIVHGSSLRPSCPVLIYGIWYMWYWYLNTDVSNYRLGLATSTDLIHWTNKGNASNYLVQSNGSIYIHGTNTKDDIVGLFYSAGGNLLYAKSTVPLTGTKIEQFTQNPDYFGDIALGTYNKIDDYAANYIYGQRVTVSKNSIVTKINMYISDVSKPTTGKIRLGLYSNVSDAPNTLLGVTAEYNWIDVNNYPWNKFDFVTPVVLTADDYWVAILSNTTYKRIKVQSGTKRWGNKSFAYNSLPATLTGFGVYDYGGESSLYLSCEVNNGIYQKALITQPTNVYFNNVKGNLKGSLAGVLSEYDWFWDNNILYVYSSELADLKYQLTYD